MVTHFKKKKRPLNPPYVWSCCTCAPVVDQIPYRISTCPSCGAVRCALCKITKVTPRPSLKQPKSRTRDLRNTRRVLPIKFIDGDNEEVIARYDTGTYENHMSHALATKLGYNIDPLSKSSFQLPNGQIVYPMGSVTASIQFLNGSLEGEEPIVCRFNVFAKLAASILLGLEFLTETETLSRHRNRFKTVPKNNDEPFKICSIGATKNRISCMVNGALVSAHADSGSEIALVDSRYVEKHDFAIKPGCEKIMYADGSVAHTQGYIEVLLTLPVKGETESDPWQKVRFHVLENCSFDFIFDEELVEDYQIFWGSCWLLESSIEGASIAPIIHLGAVEKAVAKVTNKIKVLAPSASSSSTSPQHTSPSKSVQRDKAQMMDVLERIAHLDQEENRQRFWASKQCFTERGAATELERQKKYEDTRRELEQEFAYLGHVTSSRHKASKAPAASPKGRVAPVPSSPESRETALLSSQTSGSASASKASAQSATSHEGLVPSSPEDITSDAAIQLSQLSL